MLPRQLFPWATYLCTRACTQRQFLLLPDAMVNQVLKYCAARAAQLEGIWIHQITAMSNHVHQVVTDPYRRLPHYLHWFHMHVAKCMNAYIGRDENFWNNDETNCVHVVQEPDVLSKIVYSTVNPVAAGQVPTYSEWPGVCTGPEAFGTSETIRRPPLFFSRYGRAPRAAEFKIVPPPGSEREPARYAASVKAAVVEREADLRAAGTSCNTKLDVQQIKRTDRPSSPRPKRTLKPRIACKNPQVRRDRVANLTLFFVVYRDKWALYREGRRNLKFPPGTFNIHEVHGMPCDAPPLDASWLPPRYAHPPRPPP